MSELQIFDVEGHSIRFGVAEDGRPYSVAADYAKAMRYAKTQNATDLLDEDEKGHAIIVTPGGPQRLAVIYEDGMWELIFRSTLPGAKAIKKRVKAILREIRETGSYSAVPETRALPQTFAEALRAYADEVDAHEATKQRAAELEGPASAWDALADAEGDYSVREAAQILNRDPDISTGQNRLFKTMHDIGWIDGRGEPYQRHVDAQRIRRRTASYDHPRTGDPVLYSQVRITAKGLEKLRDILRNGPGGQLDIGGA